MDGWEPHAGAPRTLPALPPHSRHAGTDGSGRVRVEIGGAARDVAVTLEPGWRSAVGTDGLAAAVLQAFAAATSAHLTAWTKAPLAGIDPPSPSYAERPSAETIARAWRELREFRRQLTALHAATESVSSPGRRVVVTVTAGRLAGMEIDTAWQRTATARELEHHVGHALRRALAQVAALPEHTLDGYPALSALLSGTPLAPDRMEQPR